MRYPHATWVPSPNTYGPRVPLRPCLIVLHVTQGEDASGTLQWFQNPASQVSAHFVVARDGQVFQCVDTAEVAWAECSYNAVGISIEHSGFSGQTLTPEQLGASLQLQRWIALNHRIPLRRTANPSGSGVIGHGELGYAGCDHPDCPGVPILHQVGVELATANRPSPAKRKEPHPVTTTTLPVPNARHVRLGAGLTGLITGFTGNLPHVPGVSPTAVFLVTTIGSMVVFVVDHFKGVPA